MLAPWIPFDETLQRRDLPGLADPFQFLREGGVDPLAVDETRLVRKALQFSVGIIYQTCVHEVRHRNKFEFMSLDSRREMFDEGLPLLVGHELIRTGGKRAVFLEEADMGCVSIGGVGLQTCEKDSAEYSHDSLLRARAGGHPIYT
jgi:hypothetical protein